MVVYVWESLPEHAADCARAALSTQGALSTWDPAAMESLPENAADCAQEALSTQDPAAMESLPGHAADCARAALSAQDPAATESLPEHAADCARAALSTWDPAATEETTVQPWVAGQGLDPPRQAAPAQREPAGSKSEGGFSRPVPSLGTGCF